MRFFANGLSVNPVIGEKAISRPNLLGSTNPSVMRGGFWLVDTLTFIMVDNGMLASSPRFRRCPSER